MAYRPRQPPVVLTAFHKQDSLDAYLHEVRSIRESRMFQPRDEDTEDDRDIHLDPNAIWLKQVGFGSFVSQLESGESVDDSSELEQTATMPRHAAAIRRRMTTLRSTVRSKQQNGEQKSDILTAAKSRQGSGKGASPRASPHGSPTPHHTPSVSPTPYHTPSHHTPSVSPTPHHTPSVSSDSPTQEDLKLHFGSPSPPAVLPATNGTTDQLPNFMIMPDALGITNIGDLSPVDLEKVRSLALLELTVTFEDHGIPLRSRRPIKIKNWLEGGQFGVPLSVLYQNDLQRDPMAPIPLLLNQMLHYLEGCGMQEEGILRVPGSAARVNALQQELEANFSEGTFSFQGRKVTDVCSLLKHFIRELPTPLLTREYLPAFASLADIEDLKEQVRTLNLLVLLLPDLHQRVLKRLLQFFERVSHQSDHNKMDITNISMVIAPNLFVALPARHSLDDVTMAAKTSHVVRLLIKYHRLLWTVPGEMLRQIRYLYEAEVKHLNPRRVQKALKQMQNQDMGQGISFSRRIQSDHHIIRVKAPLFTRVCMAVDIADGVTAGDIVQKLQRRSRLNEDVIRKRFSSSCLEVNATPSPEEKIKNPAAMGEQFLFEVGGNIGERCLSNETDMFSLYAVNPNAQWVIKPRDCPDLT